MLEALEASVAYEAIVARRAALEPRTDGDSYAESVGADDERYEQIEYIETIAPTHARAARARPPGAQAALRGRPDAVEIAERIGVSQMHVSRLIRRALTRLRTVADAA